MTKNFKKYIKGIINGYVYRVSVRSNRHFIHVGLLGDRSFSLSVYRGKKIIKFKNIYGI